MKRLEVISKALTGLGLTPDEVGCPRGVSSSALSDLMDCLTYVLFPEYTHPPKSCTSSHAFHADRNTNLEHTISHMADIMTAQLHCAFILQGHTRRISDGTQQRKNSGGEGEEQSKNNSVPIGNNSLSPSEGDNFSRGAQKKADEITEIFLTQKLQHLRWLLRTDAEAIFQNDVAATSLSEVILCYPGLRCMRYQRTAHILYHLGAPNNFTRLLTEMAHSTTGIDIHPATSIGHHFFIDHGTGIVIGASAIIGNYVSIYQGVTLGAKSFPVDKKTGERIRFLARHPIIEDGVTIYANAVVLGRVRIGKGSTIGGNCWVVQDLPPGSVIAQKPSLKLSRVDMMFHENGSGI
ncbi:putative serine acetyltransferase [Trypanosoma theileri]|uniref:serine O-acetyltransferase n=1 Tax=Trypanosoma theileri TaxID=67003 RepID=A0A1X0P9S3_9TRYP|nr:putative serine acetyltransferase [Trypanosoma theileri]ORC93684.1 putative serine acetyltransferase [Trypanosoma theileri]